MKFSGGLKILEATRWFHPSLLQSSIQTIQTLDMIAWFKDYGSYNSNLDKVYTRGVMKIRKCLRYIYTMKLYNAVGGITSLSQTSEGRKSSQNLDLLEWLLCYNVTR